MKTLLYVSTLAFIFIQTSSYAALEDISRSVVFLSKTEIVTETVKGVSYQVWLRNTNNNSVMPKTRTITGSGVIVATSNICYLVTANHVASAMGADCDIVMGGSHEEPWHFKLSSITASQPSRVGWFADPDADIAVHPLPSVTSAGIKALTHRAPPISFLISTTNAPPRDVPVIAFGFPLGLGAQGQFVPLSRESRVSSGMMQDNSGYFFLLQDPSVSGYSGGPVIESGEARLIGTSPKDIQFVTGPNQCCGFVSETYADESGGKMARIVPAFYAVNIIHQIESKVHFKYSGSPSGK